MLPILPILMLAATAAKVIGDKEKSDADKTRNIGRIRTMPWLGLKPGEQRPWNPVETTVAGLGSAYMQGQAGAAAEMPMDTGGGVTPPGAMGMQGVTPPGGDARGLASPAVGGGTWDMMKGGVTPPQSMPPEPGPGVERVPGLDPVGGLAASRYNKPNYGIGTWSALRNWQA